MTSPYRLIRTERVCPHCEGRTIDLLYGEGLACFYICRTEGCRFVGHVGCGPVSCDVCEVTAPKLTKAQRDLLASLARFGPHQFFGAQKRVAQRLADLGLIDTWGEGAGCRSTAGEVTDAGRAALKDGGK